MIIPLLSVLLAQGGHDHSAHSGPSPEPFVEMALGAHPSVEAAKARAASIKERTEPQGTLPDPVFVVGINNLPYDPLSFTATPMTGIRFGLSQTFPWPGKLGLQEDAQAHRALAAGALVGEQKNQLAAQVRHLFYDIHFVDVAIDVIRANLGIIEGFIEIADAKYRVGRGLQQDILKARVVKGQLEERLVALKRNRADLVVQLNAVIASDQPVTVPTLLNVAVTEFGALDSERLTAKADENRPLLERLGFEIAAAEKMRDLAEKDAYPDLNLTLGYTLRLVDPMKDPTRGSDFLSLSAGVKLPVWYGSKQGPLINAAHEDIRAAVSQRDTARLDIRRVINSAVEQIPQLLAQMELYRTSIIPTTKQTLQADRVAYQVDKVDFLNLLDIEMRLLNFEVDYHRLHVEREKLIVNLAQAVGTSPSKLGKDAP